jgi:glycine betaine/proline transport system substrate-binding protein
MQFRQLRVALASAVLTLASTVAHAADNWCTQGKTVHFAGITWESGSFATEVLRQIMEKGYGCKTDVVVGSTAATETAVAHNDVQVWAE